MFGRNPSLSGGSGFLYVRLGSLRRYEKHDEVRNGAREGPVLLRSQSQRRVIHLPELINFFFADAVIGFCIEALRMADSVRKRANPELDFKSCDWLMVSESLPVLCL